MFALVVVANGSDLVGCKGVMVRSSKGHSISNPCDYRVMVADTIAFARKNFACHQILPAIRDKDPVAVEWG